tara:strand:- start:365 stop:1966 length:1602 start_codon:yes stop_codon:yes gene_type:complete
MWCFSFSLNAAVDLSRDVDDLQDEEGQTLEAQKKLYDGAFGEWMFRGQFSKESFTGFNPNYKVGIGDRVNIQLWGGVEFQATLSVDVQGNLFIPKVGPVSVKDVLNKDLNERIKRSIKSIYQRNVGVYATLESAQPVKIYVTGFVKKPGLYAGLSSDSVLYFLDKSGGVDVRKGSFIDISVLRNNTQIRKINLYDFLLTGRVEPIQLIDGDTILVNSRKSVISVSGLVQNPSVFEFAGKSVKAKQLLKMAKIEPTATHMRIVRNGESAQRVDYFPVDELSQVVLYPGDNVYLVADKKIATISVRVEGEHESKQEYILPHGTTLGALLAKVQPNELTDTESIQLYRKSVKFRQKSMLNTSLQALEASLLSARSETAGEAALRSKEAQLLMQWVNRARVIEPKGQVILAESDSFQNIVLEPDDVIRFPAKSGLVMVHGEVLSPNAVAYNDKMKVLDYIDMAGGFTHKKSNSKVVVLHPSGRFSKVASRHLDDKYVHPGDEILVLPQIDTKNLQITQDVVQLIYQIAVSAGVVLAI